jgi:hypothetical protein
MCVKTGNGTPEEPQMWNFQCMGLMMMILALAWI